MSEAKSTLNTSSESRADFRLRDYLSPGGRHPYSDLPGDLEAALSAGLTVYLWSVPGFFVLAGHPQVIYGGRPWSDGYRWYKSARDCLKRKNARYMTRKTFKNLVDNIKKDGSLASVPLTWFDGQKYHVLSGNNRLKAGLEAKIERFLVLVDTRPLKRSERVAVQLSHNALSGQDDPTILRDLWDEIDELNLKYYAGLDDLSLGTLPPVQMPALTELRLDFRTVVFTFLPEELERVESALDAAIEQSVACDKMIVARMTEWERFLTSLDRVKKDKKVKSAGTALLALLDELDHDRKANQTHPGSSEGHL